MEILHGRTVVQIGNRYFAVHKDVGLADRIHAQNQMRSLWDRQMTRPAARLINTRSIRG